MLTTSEILQRVRRIEIKTKGLSNHIFAGEYHSAFKGRGMSFSEVREYTPGDDVKAIDWNVTARFSHPFVKVFEEERELTVMLLVDMSNSSLFGTKGRSKKELITEICAVLSFSAVTNQDKVGVIFFSDKIDKYIPPKKGKSHILRIIRELITIEPKQHKDTQVALALDFLNHVVKKKTIAFVLSDFMSRPYEKALQLAARRHDVIGIQVFDKADRDLPNVGLVQTVDAENGSATWIDTQDKGLRIQYQKMFEEQQQYFLQSFRKCNAGLISIRTDEDYIKKLQGFFKTR
ncbi:MAG TPA: DUF58 domain-containing protein [Flavipsychrobacter sp.]|jgi:uncharacterized protein (DUF58 family)|nr:DUF58 domain-containing protein [Flavipsychrobacter sp.]